MLINMDLSELVSDVHSVLVDEFCKECSADRYEK